MVEAGALRSLVAALGGERKDPLRPKADKLLRLLASQDKGAALAISALKRELVWSKTEIEGSSSCLMPEGCCP